MKRLFDMENPFWRALSIAADLILINLFTLVCCLPVITAGAALTAMNDMVLRIVREEEGYVFKGYFRAFAANFKQGTLLGLLLVVCAVALFFDYRAAAAVMRPMRVGVVSLALIALALAGYAFALSARFENTLGGTLKNAAVLAVAHFPRTLGAVLFAVALWLLAARFFSIGGPVLFLFGLSLPCYVKALLLKPVFRKLENPEEDNEE